MIIEIEPKLIDDILPGPILQQTGYWGHVKSMHGWKAKAFDLQVSFEHHSNLGKRKKFYDDLLLMTHSIGDGLQIAYIPYGPKILPDEELRGQFLEELSESLRPYLPPDCILIRYDLPWKSPWAQDANSFDADGKWLGPPEPRVREFRMNYGTSQWKLRKAPTDVLPCSTFLIDVDSYDDDLIMRMKAKTRYNIGLARRKGVKVREADPEQLQVMYDLYYQTAMRNGLTLNDIRHFESLLLAGTKCNDADASVHMLMAEVEEKPVAGMFLVICGGRATYLYGASSDECRNYMGTYALQWAAIRKAREAGCSKYDMFGVAQLPDPSHPMYGLYRFKSGFGGKLHHRQGCWDYPLEESIYTNFRAAELTFSGYHIS